LITFGKNPWHRRIITWGLGREYLQWREWDADSGKYKWKDERINLCPYMRALLCVFLISPWIAFWKILPKYCTYDHEDETKAFLIIGSIFSTLHVIGTQYWGFEWWWVLAFVGAVSVIVTVLIGLALGLMVLKERWDDRPITQHKPSLLKEYVKAKHDRVCPCIEFVEDESD